MFEEENLIKHITTSMMTTFSIIKDIKITIDREKL